ncbi:MAG: PorT family protein [Bacteroidetes bacterium]|nr:PorT family protein [Bacteroidota bacterium]
MKKLLFAILCMTVLLATAQDKEKAKLYPPVKKVNFTDDYTWNTWLNVPDSIKLKGTSRGFNFYIMRNFELGKSFEFSIGLGFGNSNIFFDKSIISYDDSSNTVFIDTITFKSYKLSTTYIDLPLELRFKTKPNASQKSFKIAIGGKIGYLINSHTKFKGEDYLNINGGSELRHKILNIKNIAKVRYGATARIGYGNVYLFAYYSLSTVFEKDKGPKATPFSAGLTFTFP